MRIISIIPARSGSKRVLANKKIKLQDISYKVNGGVGLDPSHLNLFIGKKLKKEIIKDQPFLTSNLKS